jgi:hypothetical protein
MATKLTEKERAKVRAEAASTDWKSNKKASAPKQEEAAYVSADGKVSFDRYGRQLGAKREQAPQQEQRNSDDYIVPRGDHPANAVYVARDKKSGAEVSFDASGRKLDSLGHVVAGDRQRAGDAGAKEIYRPPAPQPAPEFKSDAKIGATMTRGATGAGGGRSPWDNSVLPGTAGTPSGSYAVPNRGAMDTGNMFGASRWPATTRWEEGGTPHQPWRSPAQQYPARPQMGQGPTMPPQVQSSASTYDNSVPVIPMQTAGLADYQIPEPATGPVYEPFTGVTEPVTNPLDIYSQGVDPTWPAEPVGPQNYNRKLDVRDYMPGGRYYNGKY